MHARRQMFNFAEVVEPSLTTEGRTRCVVVFGTVAESRQKGFEIAPNLHPGDVTRSALKGLLRKRSNQATRLGRTVGMLSNAPIVPYIPVRDVPRARKFYEEKVGLKAKQEYAGGVIYECGKGSWVFMYPSAGAGTSQASTAFWAVEDVAVEVAALKSRGVKFEEYDMPGIKTVDGIATGGGAKTAWFKDTEGNILAVSQRL
jgi:predicted enzyme related to lactoylglutathione lyase